MEIQYIYFGLRRQGASTVDNENVALYVSSYLFLFFSIYLFL